MKVYERITNLIIEKLKNGTVPWHKPWLAHGWPRNLLTGRPYRGINVFILAVAGFEMPYWLTYNQALKLGGNIKKRESGTTIIYWKLLDFEDEDIQIPFVKGYTVFNVLQCEGIEMPGEEGNRTTFEPLDICEEIIENMPKRPQIEFDSLKAYYNFQDDKIKMPSGSLFDNTEEFYCTLFHEMIHSTGHPIRLNRNSVVNATYFGSIDYSKEELIAEMGAAFLCAH